MSNAIKVRAYKYDREGEKVDAVVSIHIPPVIKVGLFSMASRDGISMSDLVKKIVPNYLLIARDDGSREVVRRLIEEAVARDEPIV